MARKSKKVDYVNAGSMGQQTVTMPSVPKNICYKAGLYARLSEETQTNKERATIETQMELLRRFVADNDDMVAEKEYFDISCTSTNFERPGFEEMIQDMRTGRINCIIVKDLSRLGRNYVETGNYIERVFPFFDVRFIAVTDGYDSNKSGEELLMPLKNMVNEMYVKDLRKKMKTAHRAYWRNSEYSFGSVPYGYINVGRHLQPDEETAGFVQEIFRLFLEGNALKEVARLLSEKTVNPKTRKMIRFGHEIPNGFNSKWNPVTVRSILTNYAYAGISVHNRYARINGKQKELPKEEWIMMEDTHEPLISREDFDRVQGMLEENTAAFHSTHGKNGYNHARFNLLGKKIVCADCGKVMGFRIEGVKHQKRFYWCKTYLADTHGPCTNHKVSLEGVNKAVFDTIHTHMKISIDTEALVKRMNAKSESMKKYDIYGKEADRIRRELQKTTQVKAEIFEDYKEGLIDGEQYGQISEKYAAKISELNCRLDEMLKARTSFSKEYHIDGDWKKDIEKYISRRKLTREMAEAFVEKVIVYENGKLEVHLVYDDVLKELLDLGAERGGING